MIPIQFSSPVHNAFFFFLSWFYLWIGLGMGSLASYPRLTLPSGFPRLRFFSRLSVLLHLKFLYSLILNQFMIMIYDTFNSIPVIVINVNAIHQLCYIKYVRTGDTYYFGYLKY